MHKRAPLSFGTPLHLAKQPVAYSPYPLRESSRGLLVNQVVYSSSPWMVVAGSLSASSIGDDEKQAGLACLRQSEELYHAAAASTPSGAQALLYYYAFFNLIKVLLYTRGIASASQRIGHGLTVPGYAGELDVPIRIEIKPTDHNRINAFDSFRAALQITTVLRSLDVMNIASQCVVGHRLLSQSLDRVERFVSVRTGQLEIGGPTQSEKYLIASIGIREHDMERFGLDPAAFCSACSLPYMFPERAWWVDESQLMHAALVHQIGPINERDNADIAIALLSLIDRTRYAWHRVATHQPPLYRRYYVFCHEHKQEVIPQLLATYALLFYFGSMNRYHPHKFRALLTGRCGSFVHEYLITMPLQLLYLVTSEIVEQEVVRPAVTT